MDLGTFEPHPVTLRFQSATAESTFNLEYRKNAVRYFRSVGIYLLAIMIALSITGLFVEFTVNREHVQKLLWFVFIPLTIAAVIVLSVKAYASHAHLIIGVYVMLAGVVACVFPRIQSPDFVAFYGHSYLMLLALVMFPLGRLRALSGTAIMIVLLGTYLLTMSTLPGLESGVLVKQTALILAAGVFGFGIGYLIELNARRSFAARMLIEEREQQLREEKENLTRSEARLREEQEKSDALLLSVLPRSIAARLKEEGKSIADGIVECTVLFSDLVGFTGLSQELGPRALVDLLNRMFSAFDALSEKHGLEKIKTIGDAYMVAGGVPEYKSDHASAIAKMALDMCSFIEQFSIDNNLALDVRIGIHSGPVVAGIIGTKKFSYDLWGDAVNMAARMESHGLAGKIQTTEATYLLLRRHFRLEERGDVEVKGKGTLRTYWLLGKKEAGDEEQLSQPSGQTS